MICMYIKKTKVFDLDFLSYIFFVGWSTMSFLELGNARKGYTELILFLTSRAKT